MIAEAAEARRIAGEAHAVFHASLLFLWERTGVSIPTHFPPTFELMAAGGRGVCRFARETRAFVAEQVEVAGLDTMNFHLAFGNISFDNVRRTAELFATEVMPAFA